MSKFISTSLFSVGIIGVLAAAFLLYTWSMTPLSPDDARGYVHASGYGMILICLGLAIAGFHASKTYAGILLLVGVGSITIARGATLENTTSLFFLLNGLEMDSVILLMLSVLLIGSSRRPKPLAAA